MKPGGPSQDQTLLTHLGELLHLVLGLGPFTSLWGCLLAELNRPRHCLPQPPVGAPADREETATFQAPGWQGSLAASSNKRPVPAPAGRAEAEG